MARPSVSICIPNLEMAGFVTRAIESACAQTHRQLEVVVLDNASRDGSWREICEAARQDDRVRCYRNAATVPMAENWNLALRRARGRYATLLSADDELLPEFVERCLALHQQNPRLGYVFSHTSNLDAAGVERGAPAFYEASGFIPGLEEARLNLIGSHNGPSEMLIHRERLLALGGFDPRFAWAHDLYARLRLNLRWDVGYVREALCRYRVHPGNSTARIHRSKLGVMEIYRLKLEVLDNLPPRARHLSACREDVLRNLSRLCASQAERAFAEDDARLGSEYLHLAASFSLDPARPGAERHRGPPYPLPPRSRPLHRASRAPAHEQPMTTPQRGSMR